MNGRFRFRAAAALAAILTSHGTTAEARQSSPSSLPRTSASEFPLRFTVTVRDAEAAAVASSPDVAAARARVAQAEFALAAARGGSAPSLVANYAQVPQGNPPGPNITSRQLTTGVQVSIADLLANAPAVREAAFSLSAAQADETAAESAEGIKVVGLYFDALKAHAVADARRDALAAATQQRDAATVRVRAGDAPQLDVLRAEVSVARAQADVESASAADLNATDALRVETNGGPDSLAVTPGSTIFAMPSSDPMGDVALALGLRSEIVSAKRTADAAKAAAESARAATFPPLTVSGGYLTGTDSGVPINAPSISAQLTLPLSNANRDRASLARAKATEALAKLDAVVRQITLEVTASARTFGALLGARDASHRARVAAESELRATEIGYRNGASSSLEVSSARATFAQAVVDDLSAQYDVVKAAMTLQIEMGR